MPLLETDPVDLMLDPVTGDLLVGDDLVLVTGKAGIAQLIDEAVGVYAGDPDGDTPGEWFLDQTTGIPYHGEILGKKFNADRIRQIFAPVILGVEGVLSLTELEVTFNSTTRIVDLRWLVRSVFGDVDGTTGLGV